MSKPDPRDIDVRNRMQDIAHAVNDRLPEGWTFFVLVAPVGDDGRANYVSNMERKCAINVMKEWLIKGGAAEDWMKHLE